MTRRFWNEQPRRLDNTEKTADRAAQQAQRALEGDVVAVDPRRLILRSPDGHFWSVTVDDAGVLGTVDLGTGPLA